jgi:probable O-glycosylation ligase (exosortase A-associated)
MDSIRDLILLAVVLAISGIALVRPFTGLLSFLVFSIVNPHSMAWSFATVFHGVLPIALATIVGYAVSSEPKHLPRQLEVYLLLALWVVFCVSTSTAVYPDEAFAMLTYVSKILLMVFLSMAMVTTKARLLQLVRTVALSLGFFGLKDGIWAIRTGGQEMVWGPDNSFLYANNAIGVALAMNLPLLFHLRRLEQRRWVRHLMTAMMLFSYPAIVCTFSRGAWLSAGAATALMMWRSRHRWITAAALLLILPLLSAEMLPQRVVNRYDDLANYQNEGSAQSRFWTWEFCRRVGFANPLTGAGFNFNSEATYRQYYPEFFDKFESVKACHGTALTVFAEHGFPGALLWIGLLGSCLVSLQRIRRVARRAGGDRVWAIPIADMLQGAFLAFVVGSTFVDLNYFDIFYQFIAVVVMLKTLAPHVVSSVTPRQSVVPAGTKGRP